MILVMSQNACCHDFNKWIPLCLSDKSFIVISVDTLLTWGATYKKLAPDEIIFIEGAEAHFYYQLVSGSVRWVNVFDDGREFIQTMVEPGECFGELALFDDQDYVATAIANEPSIIIRLDKDSFQRLLKSDSEIHFEFTRQLVKEMRFKFLLVRELAQPDPEHRLMTLISYFKKTGRNISLNQKKVQLTRQQIADMTGLRVETVIRAVKALERKGFLSVQHGKVYCQP